MNDLIDEIHDDLFAAGILRTDVEIHEALVETAREWAGKDGWYVTPEVIHASPANWHQFLHGTGGVYELLGIDSEDALYDTKEEA